MCGVAGLLIRDRSLQPQLGSMLVTMIEALDERGPDSSGIAVYDDDPPPDRAAKSVTRPIKISLGSDEPVDWHHIGDTLSQRFGTAIDLQAFGAGMVVDASEAVEDELTLSIMTSWPLVRVLGTGLRVRVLKDTGRPTATCARYGVALVGLLSRRPYAHGHGVGGDRPALAPICPDEGPLRGAQRILFELCHRATVPDGQRHPIRFGQRL